MAMRLNESWKRQQIELVDNWKKAEGNKPVITLDTEFSLAAKWMILFLTECNIPFKVIQLGAGVKRITTDVDVCPKCHGTGRC